MSRQPAAAFFLLGFILAVSVRPAAGQLVLGQYEDEAPLGTWNTFPAGTAAGLGRGTASLAWADSWLSARTNPALLAFLPRSAVVLSGLFQLAQCQRFSLVNTGVVRSDQPLQASAYSPDGIAAGWRGGSWAAAAAVGVWESYNRPTVQIDESSAGLTSYRFDFSQTGRLWAGTVAAACRIGRTFSLGLSLHVLWGPLERRYTESWIGQGFELADVKEMDFRGLVPQGGIAWEPSPEWTLGAVVRGPWTKRSRAESSVTYAATGGQTISILDSADDDRFGQPWVAGLGAAFRPLSGLTIASDAIWFGWSGYAPRVFGEELSRDFRDVVRLSLGAEWQSDIRLFGRTFEYPLRIGLIYDPQPMRDPRSAYLDLTFGVGLGRKGFRVDLGALIGRESGSGDDLTVRRVGLSFSEEF